MVTPMAHRSTTFGSKVPDFLRSHVSGEKKAGVPAVFCAAGASPSLPREAPSASSAVPKSAILSRPGLPRPAGLTSRFSGLMSRWTIPLMCRYSSPMTRWRMNDQIVSGLSGTPTPFLPTRCDVPPGTNSRMSTISSCCGSMITSNMWTQFGWSSSFIVAISIFTESSAEPKRPCRCRCSAALLRIFIA